MTSTDINDTSTELINYNPPELETLRLDVLPGKIVVLTINRPEQRNALTRTMLAEAMRAVGDAEDDDVDAAAQDVVQEAFLRALKYFDTFRGAEGASARAWSSVRPSAYARRLEIDL